MVIPVSSLQSGLSALLAQADQPATVSNLRRLSGGGSREAWAFNAVTDAGPERELILMRYPAEGLIDGDADHEFAILQTVHGANIASPEPLWLDADGTHLGRPGFVMSREPGVADIRGVSDSDLTGLDQQLVDTLVTLHAIPVEIQQHQPFLSELARWETRLSEQTILEHPALVVIARWLRENVPDCPQPSIVHGDFRYGNVLHVDAVLSCVLDWELAHIGDPLEDIAWAFRPFRRSFAPRIPLSQFVALYERSAGCTVDRDALNYFRIFSEYKSAVIYLSGLESLMRGGSMILARPLQLVPYSLYQAALWLDELGIEC